MIGLDFTEKFICLYSTISAGLTFDNLEDQTYLDINIDNATLGEKIKETLTRSIDILDPNERRRFGDYRLSPEYLEWLTTYQKQKSKELKQIYGYRTLKELERDYMYVSIHLQKDQCSYKMLPSIFRRGGPTALEDTKYHVYIPISSTAEDIGVAARRAMSYCKSIYK